MSFFDNGPLPDWGVIRSLIGKELPWDLIKQWDNKDDSWLNEYIRKLGLPGVPAERTGGRAGSAAGSAAATQAVPSRLQMEARRQGKRVIATVKLPPGADRGGIRMHATADRLRVSHTTGAASGTLKLPCLVVPRSGRVYWKNGKWTVVFRKRPARQGEVELFIEE